MCDISTQEEGSSPQQSYSLVPPNDHPNYRVPIVGYEVTEQRARFTVFKIRIEDQINGRSWFVFRRYTDFVRLNKKLRVLFPGLRLKLPGRKWFGDNFDPIFLEDRLLGLQSFVNSIITQKHLLKSKPVQEFICADEPPGHDETLEDSRAFCESLEDTVYILRQKLKEKDAEIELLKEKVTKLQSQKEILLKSLKLECSLTTQNIESCPNAPGPLTSSPKTHHLLASTPHCTPNTNFVSGHLHRLHHLNITLINISSLYLSNTNGSVLRSPFHSCQAFNSPLVEDIHERYGGDGCTVPEERLPPLGGIEDTPILSEDAMTKVDIISENCETSGALHNSTSQISKLDFFRY
ncbi:uncharacterized protein LOC106478180 isoform X2 [Limulus polyphemus]|nr:uncharacterized protein LOC106478180 isoform X2 [Limulus polyphemus]XP_022237447.1 uncharacterized protein LOC106478180 isoform X2 [Limulus polyphemus]